MSDGAPTFDLGRLHGGLRLPAEKEASTGKPVVVAPLPAQLAIPITQHVGAAAQPVVGIGERVLKGQLIADADGDLSVPVHASSSGRVVAIEPWPVSRRHGEPAPCIVIDCDGEDEAVGSPDRAVDYRCLDRDDLLSAILDGGIAGLGGAVFPTAQKLLQAGSGRLDYLILNGVECEPYISCDDMLMRTQPREVIGGAQILLQALGLEACFLVVESDKPEAVAALAEASEAGDVAGVSLKQIPTIYPSGAEDQLVQLVTGREVPSGGLPADVGCLVQNVGTAAAVYNWIVRGEPLISRITTVTGDGVASPVNVLARIGTPIADIIGLAGGYTDRAAYLVVGGPMTGKSITTDRVPVVKATNCILALGELPSAAPSKPCIRCAECAAVCPIQLLPQQLHWYARADDEARLREFGLRDCIECGCCDLVCPSHIPLTTEFRSAKARIRELADEKARAQRAKQRFEARRQRLQEEQAQRTQELSAQKETARKVGPEDLEAIMDRVRGDRGRRGKDEDD